MTKQQIEPALGKHRLFIASVRINAFFHDLDKVYADYLLWSLSKKQGSCWYIGHAHLPGKLTCPHREKYVNYWAENYLHCSGSSIEFPVTSIYLSYLDGRGDLWTIKEDSKPGRSWYDFALYHHDLDQPDIPTSLLLFTAGTAGVDGLDTMYETEAQGWKEYSGQHVPQTVEKGMVCIATPFGHEREVELETAEIETKKVTADLAGKIKAIPDCQEQAREILSLLEPVFRQTVIRTQRPINDITLADHSLSTAALATAQAARLVLETAVRPDGEKISYCLPARRTPDPGQSPSQQTGFAVFSCAVNSGRLDAMALELKDITAIREEVQSLFDTFADTFTLQYPVGGEMYRDQHGIHIIVPMLGDPARRWVRDDNWLENFPAGITAADFVDWLFAKARQALVDNPVRLGRELLVGCRYAPILQKLNRLAGAIEWSREIAFLSAAASECNNKTGRKSEFFKIRGPDSGDIANDLCGVCGQRQGDRRRKQRKCDLCEERVREHKVDPGEIGDIEKLARYSPDNRMALLSVSFDLSNWLAEETNSGIFCLSRGNLNDNTIRRQRTIRYQRYNSFGRFRRIWRTTEIFLDESRHDIRELCKGEQGAPARMRTILLQPQDMQIILPACLAGKALDAVYEKFSEEFGRVNGRVPFHVSLCIFPFRVPIYLVLDGARRLRQNGLQGEPRSTKISRLEQNRLCRYEIFQGAASGPFDGTRSFTFPMPLIWDQDHQEGNFLKGKDYMHANIRVGDENGWTDKWKFAGEIPVDSKETAWMTDNRLALVEIGSGFSLEELAMGSEHLPPSRCHDAPLDYWPRIKRILELESRISHTQRRGLRSLIARREKLWRFADLPGATPADKTMFLAESMKTLWRDPSRFGPDGWEKLREEDRKLLVESSLNGALFLASLVEKRLQEDNSKGKTT